MFENIKEASLQLEMDIEQMIVDFEEKHVGVGIKKNKHQKSKHYNY